MTSARSVLPSDALGDDDSHPIKSVTTIDVATYSRRASRYGLVVASPLDADERSQCRLLEKLEGYINDFYSAESIARIGRPTPKTAYLTVNIHPGSDEVIFELLENCRSWVESKSISFRITTRMPGVTKN